MFDCMFINLLMGATLFFPLYAILQDPGIGMSRRLAFLCALNLALAACMFTTVIVSAILRSRK